MGGRPSRDATVKEIESRDVTRYLFTVVDVWSKYAWVEPLKAKTGAAVAAAFEQILKLAQDWQPL